MKIARRAFLSLGAGITAGLTLSPLPWKLTDDLSIWTQNWPWTPVPPDGEVEYADSVCTLCPGACGISVRKVDGRAVGIEGMKEHPVNEGGICLLGLSGLQLLYGGTRITSPLKRTGERGEGKWREISWDNAFSEVISRIGSVKATPERFACISDSAASAADFLFERFTSALGSPNFLKRASSNDLVLRSLSMMYEKPVSYGYDFENADYILSFGTGLIDGWGSPVRMMKTGSLWKKNRARLIQVEPRLSNTAAKSDRWIPVNPGTESVLALAVLRVLLEEGLYNEEAVNRQFNGFVTKDGGVKKLILDRVSIAEASRITGVGKETVRDIASHFAASPRPLAVYGRGEGITPGAFMEFWPVFLLNVVSGNINKTGGFHIYEADRFLNLPAKPHSIGTHPPSGNTLNEFIENAASSTQPPVELLMVAGGNPLYTLPDTSSSLKAFEQAGFIVSFSPYMNETALYSDLILPDHDPLETFSLVYPEPASTERIYALARPVTRPRHNTENRGDAILKIAAGAGGDIASAFMWKDFNACLKDLTGKNWRELANNGFKAAETRQVQGKAGLIPLLLENHIENTLMHSNAAPVEGAESEYPLLLIPSDSIRITGGAVADPPFMVKTIEDSVLKKNDIFVEINPETALPLGLADGRAALLSTPRGTARVRVRFSEGIILGAAAMSRGLGHTAFNDYISGKGVNYNSISGPLYDTVTGLDAAWGIRAKLTQTV